MTVDALDPLIHVPARLQIVATLAALPDGDALSFTRMQDMIGLTAGNLITHLRKLEDAGYVSVQKRFVERKPQTRYALTERGRKALLDHVAHLETLLRRKKSTGEKGK